ncbi:MAG: hypothetical protein OXF56_12585 [Rhodobacteraceae bacterium]|nr:hypothetical protein [Paracoccaceae bacterium]
MRPGSGSGPPVRLLDEMVLDMAKCGEVRQTTRSADFVNAYGIVGVHRGLDCSSRRDGHFVQARSAGNDRGPSPDNKSAGAPGAP